MKDALPVLLVVAILGWSVFGPAAYALLANKLTRDREPWFSSVMILGLAFTCYVTSLASGASFKMCLWFFGIGTLWFLVVRRLFGKGSSFEMYMGPHILIVLGILLLPVLQHARMKAQQLNRLSQQYETAHQK
ncbi:MAG TPA: hypothetical protein VGY56_11005 [Verrucomicrobiae bacterium]|nr:hypothetical protein [Verrucomicrobiae bacterium]